MKDRGHGGAARREGDVDADPLEQAKVTGPAHPRHDLRDAELPAEQRRQQVALVVVDDAHHHVAAADVLGLEQPEVGAIAVEHECAAQPGRQLRPARGVALDDADVDVVALLEPLGDVEADIAAADDRHLLVSACLARADQGRHLAHRLRRAHDDDLVARRKLRRAPRHEQLTAAFDRDDQRAAWQMQAAHGRSHQGGVGFEPVLQQPHDASGEHLRVDRPGRGDDLFDVGGELRLGPQHAVDSELFQPGFRGGAEKIGARHQADGFGTANLVGNRASDDVDLVQAGAGHEERCVLDAGPDQYVRARAASEDELHVHARKHVGHGRILIDHEHFMVGSQGAGERGADLPAADDHDVHRYALVEHSN